MKSPEIRKSFLKYFEERGHTIVPSASLVPRDDPTLLFTIAGIVQFKPLFAGTIPLPYKRAASVQKCLRVTDLENVGKDCSHNTFFEMLGNFSFGDYFKKEAIEWAWEYLIKVLTIDKKRLYVSVFREDDEAYNIWAKDIRMEARRIVRLGEKDNFWGPAGGTGACGPCSEIFWDMGEEYGCRRPECYVGCDCERYIEIWNLVFPQYNQKLDGTRLPLKNRGIDTGMGFERLITAFQNAKSIYHTDLFKPIIDAVANYIGVEHGKDNTIDINLHIIADHVRALVFAITDGVIPSNEERGYILRKLLRRGLRAAQRLNYEEPILYRLVGVVVHIMKDVYPELVEKSNQIALIIKSEEERFLKTLTAGLAQFETIVKGKKVVEGRDAFKLYDTYGFPFDLIVELAHEQKIEVDQAGFDKAMEEQRLTSRKSAKFAEKGRWNIIKEGSGIFVGYERDSCETEIIRWLKIGDLYEIVLSETPFYAEAGGQIGETGKIKGEGFTLKVLDTFYSQGMIVHECHPAKGSPGTFKPGKVTAEVDLRHRRESARAHTATHLLQAVLKKVLGEHVRQEGSLVEPGEFRFDFLHFNPLSRNELELVEKGVYELIVDDIPVEKSFMPFAEARQRRAVALFGEKYGEVVRVVKIGDHSIELCGGIHVDRTCEIGMFKIQSESSAAAGIRRIVALVGTTAYNEMREQQDILEELTQLIGADPVKRIQEMMIVKKELENKCERWARADAQAKALELVGKAEKLTSFSFVTGRVPDADLDMLRLIADGVNEKIEHVVGLLFGEPKEKLNYIIFVSRELSKQFNAVELIKMVGEIIGGGGGGRSYLAEGGGGNKEKIDEAVQHLRQFLSAK